MQRVERWCHCHRWRFHASYMLCDRYSRFITTSCWRSPTPTPSSRLSFHRRSSSSATSASRSLCRISTDQSSSTACDARRPPSARRRRTSSTSSGHRPRAATVPPPQTGVVLGPPSPTSASTPIRLIIDCRWKSVSLSVACALAVCFLGAGYNYDLTAIRPRYENSTTNVTTGLLNGALNK